MEIQELLKSTSFGERVAEEESEHLSQYFVETDDWSRLRSGRVDVVYGPKGAGKSALYSLLIARTNYFFDQDTLLVPCENPRGAPAFKALNTDPPASEVEFVAIWKLYFACLLSATLREYGVCGADAQSLHDRLIESGLLSADSVPLSLSRVLASAYDYVKRVLRPSGVEFGASIEPLSQMPSGVTAKILFSEPTVGQLKRGYTTIDETLALADRALQASGNKVWLLLDRLDVAFSDSADLEANALRALFRTYLDLNGLSNVKLKIFLRTDIWKQITESGFREGSHVTRHITIEWSPASLLNLVVRRALQNAAIREHFGVERSTVLGSADAQKEFFYRMFPAQVDVGPNKPDTFDWMLTRVRDGLRQSAPRELIHLLNELRVEQVRSLELGGDDPDDGRLFSRAVFKDALKEVSRTRLEQTLYAEFPGVRHLVEKLRGEKTQHSLETLSNVWRLDPAETEKNARFLVSAGFFEQRGSKQSPSYWVPFLYRSALGMVQGAAD